MGIITMFITYLLSRPKPGGLFLDLGGVDLCLDLHLVVLVSANVINHKTDSKLKKEFLKISRIQGVNVMYGVELKL